MSRSWDNPAAGVSVATQEPMPRARIAALVVSGVVAAAALAYVKWMPLPAKIAAAVAQHTLGTSMLTGGAAAPPAPSWDAAWSYALAYYGAVWMAVVAGILIATAVQALAPQRFFQRFLADSSLKATVLAAVGALPAMF